jgi:hypothetical protein
MLQFVGRRNKLLHPGPYKDLAMVKIQPWLDICRFRSLQVRTDVLRGKAGRVPSNPHGSIV